MVNSAAFRKVYQVPNFIINADVFPKLLKNYKSYVVETFRTTGKHSLIKWNLVLLTQSKIVNIQTDFLYFWILV